ncbi:deoxycytidylate deaminase-like isoform X2 [Epinephelus fuscoguttatus]|uniref:deoxycytidylate deaminase-like isoform X2 n=1 Tax=Epinephelus fuscoguttatus TaxID=293821 RepID=UPI0020D0A4FC|nr:deoxycytidylate deaminase-like isoform X2 [Epinephelus fuscoguttatus]
MEKNQQPTSDQPKRRKISTVDQDFFCMANSTENGAAMARTDILVSSDYFMAVAVLSAQRSKDPSTQVGACIVNQENKVVGVGNNGMPNGCDDAQLPWARSAADPLKTKYLYVCHAELNAIMNKNSADLRGCTIYVTLFPCNECAKLIIQAGIKEVVYLSDKYHDSKETVASKKLLSAARIQCRMFEPTRDEVVIPLTTPEN